MPYSGQVIWGRSWLKLVDPATVESCLAMECSRRFWPLNRSRHPLILRDQSDDTSPIVLLADKTCAPWAMTCNNGIDVITEKTSCSLFNLNIRHISGQTNGTWRCGVSGKSISTKHTMCTKNNVTWRYDYVTSYMEFGVRFGRVISVTSLDGLAGCQLMFFHSIAAIAWRHTVNIAYMASHRQHRVYDVTPSPSRIWRHTVKHRIYGVTPSTSRIWRHTVNIAYMTSHHQHRVYDVTLSY
jgi:hypothetical protein